ncbi:hypothetical protein BH10PSE4_BH10PSE4_37020 [soil metagenome]
MKVRWLDLLDRPLEQPVAMGVVVVAGLIALMAVVRTMEPSRIERMRANSGYVLIDNRTRYGVLALTSDLSGQVCGKMLVPSGNRARARACGAWSRLQLRGRGGEVPLMNVAQGAVYEVRWKDGQLQAQVQDVY